MLVFDDTVPCSFNFHYAEFSLCKIFLILSFADGTSYVFSANDSTSSSQCSQYCLRLPGQSTLQIVFVRILMASLMLRRSEIVVLSGSHDVGSPISVDSQNSISRRQDDRKTAYAGTMTHRASVTSLPAATGPIGCVSCKASHWRVLNPRRLQCSVDFAQRGMTFLLVA